MHQSSIGIIGTGSFARTFVLPALKMLPVRLAAAYDISQPNVADAASRFGIETICNSLDELLARKDLDLVCIHTIPEPHADILERVIESGHDFLCEKPVGLGSAHVRAALAAATKAGLFHAVDHEFRYAPVYRYLHQLVRERFFGDIRYVLCTAMNSLGLNPAFPSSMCNDKTLHATGGGLLPQSLSHNLDLMHHIFGDVTFTGGQCATVIPEKPLGVPGHLTGGMGRVDAEDAVALCGHLSNGCPVALNATWSVTNGSGTRWEVYGSEGSFSYVSTEPLWDGTRGAVRVVARDGTAREGLPTGSFAPPKADVLENFSSIIAAEFAEVLTALRDPGAARNFATLESELKVWMNIERARGVALV